MTTGVLGERLISQPYLSSNACKACIGVRFFHISFTVGNGTGVWVTGSIQTSSLWSN